MQIKILIPLNEQLLLTGLGGISLIVSTNYWLLLPSVILLVICALLWRFYSLVACDVKRLEAVGEYTLHFVYGYIFFVVISW